MIRKCLYSCSNPDGIIIAIQCFKALIMSRRYLTILLLLPFLFIPQRGFSQTIRDSNSKLIAKISGGEIRDSNSRKLGSISSDGTVRNNSGKKLGTIQDGRILNENGLTIFKYDDSGTVRDRNGRLIYKISNGEIRNSSSKLLFKYEDIELTHLIAYLCFFNFDFRKSLY